jgi:hypothetical protein
LACSSLASLDEITVTGAPGCGSGRLAISKCGMHAPAFLALKDPQVVDPSATIVGQMSALWLARGIGRPVAKV